MAGKGDTRRPAAVSEEEVERRWRQTFGPVEEVEPPGTRSEVDTLDVLAAADEDARYLRQAVMEYMGREIDREIMGVHLG